MYLHLFNWMSAKCIGFKQYNNHHQNNSGRFSNSSVLHTRTKRLIRVFSTIWAMKKSWSYRGLYHPVRYGDYKTTIRIPIKPPIQWKVRPFFFVAYVKCQCSNFLANRTTTSSTFPDLIQSRRQGGFSTFYIAFGGSCRIGGSHDARLQWKKL